MSFVEIDERIRSREWSMSELQSHDYFEMYFLLEGSRRLFIDDKIFDISAPAACVIPPFCMHKTEGGAYRRINVNVSTDIVSEGEWELLRQLSKKAAFGLDAEKAAFLIDLLKHAAALSPPPLAEKRLSAALVTVTLAFLNEECLIPYDRASTQHSTKGDAAVMQAVAYIKQNFHRDFSLDELSRALFISKNALCAKFRERMNCSVMEYRAFMRIARAKELLVSTRMSLGEIAEHCGYSSANYFSLIFKKEVGLSPMNYRKAK